jgi:hypothetical protein
MLVSAIAWMALGVLRRWLSRESKMKLKSKWFTGSVLAAGVMLGAVLGSFAVDYLQSRVFDQINQLPPTAAGSMPTTYYVGPAGSDTYPGTRDQPFQTLQVAADKVNPGDTVIVKDGVYTTANWAMVDVNRSGKSGYPITFKAENPNGATLLGSNNATEYAWHLEPNVEYVTIRDFHIAEFSKHAFFVNQNSNIQIIGNQVHDIGRLCTDTGNGLTGIYIESSSNVMVRNNLFRDIGRYAAGENGCQPTNQYYQNHDHGIYMNGVSKVTVQANAFYNFRSGWGIQFYSGSGNISSNINIPYRDGHIVFASPGVSSVSVTNNQFYQPRQQALNFNSDISYNTVTITNNITYGATITSSKPSSGVTVSSNKAM